MTGVAILDRAFSAVLARMVRTGQAPHYVELAAELGVDPETGRGIVNDLMASGIPALDASRYRLHRVVPAVQQSTHAIPDHHRRAPALVRAVRLRSAGRAMAVSGPGGPSRRAVPRLRRMVVDRDARRRDPSGDSSDHGRVQPQRGRRRCRFTTVSLSGHEPLPVGRARTPLGLLRRRLGSHADARGRLGRHLLESDVS